MIAGGISWTNRYSSQNELCIPSITITITIKVLVIEIKQYDSYLLTMGIIIISFSYLSKKSNIL